MIIIEAEARVVAERVEELDPWLLWEGRIGAHVSSLRLQGGRLVLTHYWIGDQVAAVYSSSPWGFYAAP